VFKRRIQFGNPFYMRLEIQKSELLPPPALIGLTVLKYEDNNSNFQKSEIFIKIYFNILRDKRECFHS